VLAGGAVATHVLEQTPSRHRQHVAGSWNGAGATGQREPGGFAYLGVPTNTSPPSTSAQAASTSARQSGGGPFSP
jgi:hypothetical protein